MSHQNSLIQTLQDLEAEALSAIRAAPEGEVLEALRISFLGRKEGRITGILKGLGDLSADERPPVGAEANRVKEVLQEALKAREAEVAPSGGQASAWAEDLTLPARHRWKGSPEAFSALADRAKEGLGVG